MVEYPIMVSLRTPTEKDPEFPTGHRQVAGSCHAMRSGDLMKQMGRDELFH